MPRRAAVYEAALAPGYCLFVAGMYVLARYALAEKVPDGTLR